jgi:hypothetical protein
MRSAYILAGPAGCGNAFGFFHGALVPAGHFAVVRDGEYANGGFGPSTCDGVLYATREAAERALSHFEEA